MDKAQIGSWKLEGWRATLLGLFLLIGWHSIFIVIGYMIANV